VSHLLQQPAARSIPTVHNCNIVTLGLSAMQCNAKSVFNECESTGTQEQHARKEILLNKSVVVVDVVVVVAVVVARCLSGEPICSLI